MQVIMSTAGRYELQELEFGQVYKWHPETVVVECDCGERPTLTSATTTCECGADHTDAVREWLAVRRREEAARPWRYYCSGEEDAGLPC